MADTANHGSRGAREIYATHAHDTVRVYQAYNEKIASLAAASGGFQAPRDAGLWGDRMTWIKPSAAWMAYRCGWTIHKDGNQARVLALDLDRTSFERLLLTAVETNDKTEHTPGAFKNKPVVVQWDPERALDPAHRQDRRGRTNAPYLNLAGRGVLSLQVGLRGDAAAMLLDRSFVRHVTDVTAQFHAAHAALEAGDLAAARAALCPDERRLDVPSELRRALGMADVDRDGDDATTHAETSKATQLRPLNLLNEGTGSTIR